VREGEAIDKAGLLVALFLNIRAGRRRRGEMSMLIYFR
jgi:hypothetical protein